MSSEMNSIDIDGQSIGWFVTGIFTLHKMCSIKCNNYTDIDITSLK